MNKAEALSTQDLLSTIYAASVAAKPTAAPAPGLPSQHPQSDLIKLTNCSRDSLFWWLVQKQIIDQYGNLVAETPTTLPALTDLQLKRLTDTLDEPIPVCDFSGNLGFHVTLNEIIGYIKEFRPSQRIELVGGWITKILEVSNNPQQILAPFNIPGLNEFLDKHPLDECHHNPSDRDLRIHLPGITKKERFDLFEFILAKLAKKTNKGTEHLKAVYFTKLSNPNEYPENASELGNRFLIFGLGDRKFKNLEIVVLDNLRRSELFSSECVKVSVPDKQIHCIPQTSSEFLPYVKKVWQGLFDRLLQRARIDKHETLDSYAWYKSIVYSVKGTVCTRSKDSEALCSKLPQGDEIQLLEDFKAQSLKQLREHCKEEPLNGLAYLFNFYVELVRRGKRSLWPSIWGYLAREHPQIVQTASNLYPAEKLFSGLASDKPPNFEQLKHLIHPLAWICTRTDGNAKNRECRVLTSLKGVSPSIELKLKGSNRLDHSPGVRSEYTFWLPFDPKQSWSFLENLSEEQALIFEDLLPLFLSDLKTEQLFKTNELLDWSETDLLNATQKLLAHKSPGAFQLGFWLMLILKLKNPTALADDLLKHCDVYFSSVSNVHLKKKAALIISEIYLKTTEQVSSGISSALEVSPFNSDQWLTALINDVNWGNYGLQLWRMRRSRPTDTEILEVLEKSTRMLSIGSLLDLLRKECVSIDINELTAYLAKLIVASHFNPSELPKDLKQWVLETLVHNGFLELAYLWVQKTMGSQSLTAGFCRSLSEKGESYKRLVQEHILKQNMERLWELASPSQIAKEVSDCLHKQDVAGAFNWISMLEREGFLTKHLHDYQDTIRKALQALATPQKLLDSAHASVRWEYNQARILLINYPKLYEGKFAERLQLILQLLDKIQTIVKSVEKTHNPNWYIALASDYFSLLIKEFANEPQLTDKVYEAMVRYLEEMNYLSYPLSQGNIEILTKLFAVVAQKLKAVGQINRVCTLLKTWNLRGIPLPNDSLTRNLVLSAYVSRDDLSAKDKAYVQRLIEEFLADNTTDLAADDLELAYKLIPICESSKNLRKLFSYLHKHEKDKEKALQPMVARLQSDLIRRDYNDAYAIYTMDEFASKRADFDEQFYKHFVHEKNNADLCKAFNILKNSKRLSRDHWEVMLQCISQFGNSELVESSWKHYQDYADIHVTPKVRSGCWMYGLTGIVKYKCQSMHRIIQNQDILQAVFRVPGANLEHRVACSMLYLEGAVAYLKKHVPSGPLALSVSFFRKGFLNSVRKVNPEMLMLNLTDGEKTKLCGLTMDLIDIRREHNVRESPGEIMGDALEAVQISSDQTLLKRQGELLDRLLTVNGGELNSDPDYQTVIINIFMHVLQIANLPFNREAWLRLVIGYCTKQKTTGFAQLGAQVVCSCLCFKFKDFPKDSKLYEDLLMANIDALNSHNSEHYSQYKSLFYSLQSGLAAAKLINAAAQKKVAEEWLLHELAKMPEYFKDGDIFSESRVEVPFQNILRASPQSLRTPEYVAKLVELLNKLFDKGFYHAFSLLNCKVLMFILCGSGHEKLAKSSKIGMQNNSVYQNKKMAPVYPIYTTVFQKGFDNDLKALECVFNYYSLVMDHFLPILKKNISKPQKAILLDFSMHILSIVMQSAAHLNSSKKAKAVQLYEMFTYSVGFSPEDAQFIAPHINAGECEISNVRILVLAHQMDVFKECPEKYIEFAIYNKINALSLASYLGKSKLSDDVILLGISQIYKNLINRHLNDLYYLINIFDQLPTINLLEDPLRLLPFIKSLAKDRPELFQRLSQDFKQLLSRYISFVTKAIAAKSRSVSTDSFFEFLTNEFFPAELKSVSVREWAGLLLSHDGGHCMEAAQYIYKKAMELKVFINNDGAMVQNAIHFVNRIDK